MPLLGNTVHLSGNEMAARFVSPLRNEAPLFVFLPGGPFINSHYLESFCEKLGKATSINCGILDLPNHGLSKVDPSRIPLNYSDTFEMVSSAIQQLTHRSKNILLGGHSFGARLAFDIAARTELQIAAAFLISLPAAFAMSQAFLKEVVRLPAGRDPLDTLRKNWAKVLTFYTHKPLQKDAFETLYSPTFWDGNEQMVVGADPIEDVSREWSRKKHPYPIGIFSGEFDTIVPDDNEKTLKLVLPSASYFVVSHAGHFPMLEKEEEMLRTISDFVGALPHFSFSKATKKATPE